MADAGLCPHCGATLLETGPEAPLGHWYCPYCLGELPAAETLARRGFASPGPEASRASLAERWSSAVDRAADAFDDLPSDAEVPPESIASPAATLAAGSLSVEQALELAKRQGNRRSGFARVFLTLTVSCVLGLAAIAAGFRRQEIVAWYRGVFRQPHEAQPAPTESDPAPIEISGTVFPAEDAPSDLASLPESASEPIPIVATQTEKPATPVDTFPTLNAAADEAVPAAFDRQPESDPFTVEHVPIRAAESMPLMPDEAAAFPIAKSSPADNPPSDSSVRTSADASPDASDEEALTTIKGTSLHAKVPQRLPEMQDVQPLAAECSGESPCATDTATETSRDAEGDHNSLEADSVSAAPPPTGDPAVAQQGLTEKRPPRAARIPSSPVVTSVGTETDVQLVGATEPIPLQSVPADSIETASVPAEFTSPGAPDLGMRRDPPLAMADLQAALTELQSATACRVCNGTGTVARARRGGSNSTLRGATATTTMPCKACSGHNVRGVNPNVYLQFCQLAEIVTFVEVGQDPSELATAQLNVGQAVLRVTNTREKLNSVGRQASQRLTAPTDEAPSGVLLAGTVQDSGTAGELYFVRIVLFGTPKSVTIISREPAPFEPHERVAILGVVVADPATHLAGYQGTAAQVVWGGYRLALPTR